MVKVRASRPFRVVSGNLRVTALGTEFLVDLRAREPYVAVTEHAVEASIRQRVIRVEQGEGLRLIRINQTGKWNPWAGSTPGIFAADA